MYFVIVRIYYNLEFINILYFRVRLFFRIILYFRVLVYFRYSYRVKLLFFYLKVYLRILLSFRYRIIRVCFVSFYILSFLGFVIVNVWFRVVIVFGMW